MDPVHIVIPTAAVGGAEKRFLGLFVGLAESHPHLRLVVSEALLETARGIDEFSRLRSTLEGRVLTFRESRPLSLQRTLAKAFVRLPRSVFHYVLVPPPLVQWFPSRRVVFTIPLSGMNLYGRVGRMSLYAGALAAARTDFLDRGVRDHVAQRLPWLEERFSVTPGSYVDPHHYRAKPSAEKENLVVFVGLFSHEKQAYRLVDTLPNVVELLRKSRHPRVAFRLFGRENGTDPPLADMVGALAGRVDVEARFEREPRTPLSRAKVFLSLQRNTNYPSKSLLEALACGALPVITDVGDSARMVPPGVAEWIPRDFRAEELAEAIRRILDLTNEEHDARVARARAHVEAHFSFRAMASYYQDLWQAVA